MGLLQDKLFGQMTSYMTLSSLANDELCYLAAIRKPTFWRESPCKNHYRRLTLSRHHQRRLLVMVER